MTHPARGSDIPHVLDRAVISQRNGHRTATMNRQRLCKLVRLLSQDSSLAVPLEGVTPGPKGSEFCDDMLAGTPVGRICFDALEPERVPRLEAA